MSTDITFWIGTTWTIYGTAQQLNDDGSYSPLDLTGGTIELRIASPTGEVLKTDSGQTGLITIPPGTAAQGKWVFNLPPDDTTQQGFQPNVYDYDVISIDQNGGVEPQNSGKCTVLSTIKSRFG